MKKTLYIFRLLLIIAVAAPALTFMSCEQPPTVVLDPDLTSGWMGNYAGNYVVNYEADPSSNYSSQIQLVVTKVDKTIIRIDAQGGDSFECTISGSTGSVTFSNITSQKGAYANADEIEGYYSSGLLYYKVSGTINNGNFYAEFTVL